MVIGVPKEIKDNEFRVGMVPSIVRELAGAGHTVLVETGAGVGSGFPDEDFQRAGAAMVPGAAEIFARAELVVKVKEPQPGERAMLRKGQVLFTYLHLAPDRPQADGLMASGATCIAYETVLDRFGGLPLLAPMSEVAGRMAIQAGAMALEKSHGGAGILLGGVPGVAPGRVLILGGGVVGANAARIAIGIRADVTILDKSVGVLRALDGEFQGRVRLIHSNADVVEEELRQADLVIGAVLVPGAAAPKLIQKKHLTLMKPGSVIVDVAIDQGGCAETSRASTHTAPTYVVDNVVHYCVANMPGAVARTSTLALTNATFPYVLKLANQGWRQALAGDPGFLKGLNIHDGAITCREVADNFGLPWTDPAAIVAG